MKLAAAQLLPIPGDVDANVTRHIQVIGLAASLGVGVLFFPELSLTGYEPKLARSLAMDVSDRRLAVFQVFSDAQSMVIGVGVPLRAETGVEIGTVWFAPHRLRRVYSKQFLHVDEYPYFVPGTAQLLLDVDGQRLVPAICYESLLIEHAEKAASLSADIYLASVAKSESGLSRAYAHYPVIARNHAMSVLMANQVGPSDNFICAGRSSAWGSDGSLLASMADGTEGLVVLDTDGRRAMVHELEAGPGTPHP